MSRSSRRVRNVFDHHLERLWPCRGGISITRQEYRLSRSKELPVLAFIKGDAALQREAGTADLIKEIVKDGLKYKRFYWRLTDLMVEG
jgi:hypothetical protein